MKILGTNFRRSTLDTYDLPFDSLKHFLLSIFFVFCITFFPLFYVCDGPEIFEHVLSVIMASSYSPTNVKTGPQAHSTLISLSQVRRIVVLNQDARGEVEDCRLFRTIAAFDPDQSGTSHALPSFAPPSFSYLQVQRPAITCGLKQLSY